MRLSRSARAAQAQRRPRRSRRRAAPAPPVLVGSPLAIKLDSPARVIFRQAAAAATAAIFRIAKFRTMYVGAEARQQPTSSRLERGRRPALQDQAGDPRITRVGALPAPHEHRRAAAAVERAARRDEPRRPAAVRRPRGRPDHRLGSRRLDMTPGITGLWQVLGRNDIPFDEMVKLDYLYVTNWSLWWDIQILCQTVPVVLGSAGCVLMAIASPPRRAAADRLCRRLRGPGVQRGGRTSRACSPTSRRGPSSSPAGCRVIIVDDGSTDGTADLVEAYDGPLPVERRALGDEPGPGAAFRAGFARGARRLATTRTRSSSRSRRTRPATSTRCRRCSASAADRRRPRARVGARRRPA